MSDDLAANLRMVYRAVKNLANFPGLDLTRPIGDTAFDICASDGLAHACNIAQSTLPHDLSGMVVPMPMTPRGIDAVYVIAPEVGAEVCKIGIASAPGKRLSALQSSHWQTLKIHALAWCYTPKGAAKIEARCHKIAAELGRNVRGEWIAATPESCAELIVKAARDVGLTIYSSAMHVENVGAYLASKKSRFDARLGRHVFASGEEHGFL